MASPASILFVVPGPVVPWMRTTISKSGARYTPQAQRDYQAHIKSCAWAELAKRGWLNTWPTNGRYAIVLQARVADYRARDLDNITKTLKDAVKPVIWVDDSRVDDSSIKRFIDSGNLGLTVRVDVLVSHWASGGRKAAS